MPAGSWLLGLIIGLLSSLVALGMALVYKANRALNFAQGDLGAVPTMLVVGLMAASGLSFWLAVPIGLVASLVLGALVEMLIIRRFFKSPRLLLMVATIGLSQLLIVGGLLLPRLWGTDTFADRTVAAPVRPPPHARLPALRQQRPPGADRRAGRARRPRAVPPLHRRRHRHPGQRGPGGPGRDARHPGAADPHARVVARRRPLVHRAVPAHAHLRRHQHRFAQRRPPWRSRSPPSCWVASTTSPRSRPPRSPCGVVEQGIYWNNPDNPGLVYPVLGVILLVFLLVRRAHHVTQGRRRHRVLAGVRGDPAGPRRAARAVRRPDQLAGCCSPSAWRRSSSCRTFLTESNTLKAATVAVFAMIGLSVIVLTGWAGQVSLGQMAFVAVGAAVGAVATSEWNVDLTLGIIVAGLAGAVTVVVVGLPALRLKGFYLAVTTLAFALAASNYLLNRKHMSWIPTGRVERPELWKTFDLTSPAGDVQRLHRRDGAVVRAGRRHPQEPPRPGARRRARQREGRAGLRRVGPAGQDHRLRALRASSPRPPAACSCT